MARRFLAPLVVAAVMAAGCTGVPQAGAVHKVGAQKNQDLQRDFVHQVAAGPVKGAQPGDIVTGLVLAMQAADPTSNVISEYLTPSYAPKWRDTRAQSTTVFTDLKSPTTSPDNTSVNLTFTVVGTIDSHGNYRRSNVSTTQTVKFALDHSSGEWRVAGIDQQGLLLSSDALPSVFAPVRIYYPSQEAQAPGVLPRLVPDTVYIKADYTENDLVTQLISGPTPWLSPGVYTPVPSGASFQSVQVDSTGTATLTFNNLGSAGTGDRLKIFEAQLAYTLSGDPRVGQTANTFVVFDGSRQVGQPVRLQTLSDQFNPDLLDVRSPLFYVDAEHHLVSSVPAAPSLGQAPTTPATAEVVLTHVESVQRLAVSPMLDVGGTSTQLVAGVRGSKLELTTLDNPAPHPWTEITIPGATKVSAPTFEVNGGSVWTVATMTDGTRKIYAVPIVGTSPQTPLEVPVLGATKLSAVTTVRLSRDGSRIALINQTSATVTSAYVAVVAQATSGWEVHNPVPVIGSHEHLSDIDVFWADRFTIGVVTRSRKDPTATALYTVNADGTPVGTDAEDVQVAGPPDSAVQFAGAPNRPWTASIGGKLFEQPVSSDPTARDLAKWRSTVSGSWPTYAD